MKIKFRCACGHKLRVPASRIGVLLTCSECGSEWVVPAPGDSRVLAVECGCGAVWPRGANRCPACGRAAPGTVPPPNSEAAGMPVTFAPGGRRPAAVAVTAAPPTPLPAVGDAPAPRPVFPSPGPHPGAPPREPPAPAPTPATHRSTPAPRLPAGDATAARPPVRSPSPSTPPPADREIRPAPAQPPSSPANGPIPTPPGKILDPDTVIKFLCACGKKVRLEFGHYGRKGDCPRCGKALVYPDLERDRRVWIHCPCGTPWLRGNLHCADCRRPFFRTKPAPPPVARP